MIKCSIILNVIDDLDLAPFTVFAWGECSPATPPHRDDLPPVAIERARAAGWPGEAADAVIIGDTEHDIRCARVNGLWSLGVATGRHLESATRVLAEHDIPAAERGQCQWRDEFTGGGRHDHADIRSGLDEFTDEQRRFVCGNAACHPDDDMFPGETHSSL